ncbi:MAG: YqaA family protein [Candidatus Methylacidiphilales bacterium]
MNPVPIETTGTKPNALRRLYAWTMHWSGHRRAPWALGFLSFIESSFFPIPPDPLLMAMCYSEPKKWVRYATICTLTSVAGGALGYAIGYAFWETVGQPIVAFYHGQDIFDKIQDWYDRFGFWGILMAAITPIPYKIFTIASGVFHFSLPMLIAASLLGRGVRFFAVAAVIRFGGTAIKPYLEKYLEIATLLLFLVGVAGFLLLKWIK